MFNISVGLFLLFLLLLPCLISKVFCLSLRATERALYTGFTGQALASFFSLIPPFKENYNEMARLFMSKTFSFKSYHSMPATVKELEFIETNHKDLLMLHMVQIHRVQETEYGKEWLLRNLDKLEKSDIGLAFLQPSLFTLEQQRDILTFALDHQRPFIWQSDFCTAFPDLNVFDHGWLWLYLDPTCYSSLTRDRRPSLINILQKRVKQEANPTAILFLILTEQSVNWREINMKQQELKTLLQEYEKVLEKKDYSRLWELYESLIIHFKDSPLGKYSAALPSAWILFANYISNDELQIRKETMKFMETYTLDHLNWYLVGEFCRQLFNFNKRWKSKFKIPSNWNGDLKEKYFETTSLNIVPFNSRLERWRGIIMRLSFGELPNVPRAAGHVYPNSTTDGMLTIEHYTKMLDQLVIDKDLILVPNMKFKCKNVRDGESIKLIWEAKIYQMAIHGTLSPQLSEKFKEAIFKTEKDLEKYKNNFKELTDAICLDSNNLQSFEDIKTIITLTKQAIKQNNIAFCYAPQIDDNTLVV